MIMDKAEVKFKLIYEMVTNPESCLSVTEMCSIAGVSRSGYYRWVGAKEAREEREKNDKADFELVLQVYKRRGYSKGGRSIYMGLLHQDPPVIMNIKKIRRLMKKYGLFCPIRKANPYRRMAKALRTNNVADYILKRKFKEFGPRMVLLTDITYLRYNERFAYLSTIIDAFTKQVLAYRVSDSLQVDFVLETVNELIEKHWISLSAETIINSDQGCHYTSYRFIQIVKDAELRQSMSRRANCWDNAPQECFFGHMKDEIDISGCTKFEQVKKIIDDWIDYYNTERYQWGLAKLAPDEFYNFIQTGKYPLNVPNPPKPDDFLNKIPSDINLEEIPDF